MANEQSRITVVGTHRRVDIAVPSGAPIGEYAARLAEMCGQNEPHVMPPAWSLAAADTPAFPLEATLYEMGVVDGQVLYLRDLTTEPGDAPVVKDLDEVVADEAARQRRRRLHAAPALIGSGLLWLVVTVVVSGVQADGGIGTTVAFLLTGLVLLGIGWGLQQRKTAMPAAMLPLVSLAAIPCLAVAGSFTAVGLGGPQFRWAGIVAGANLAAMMALAITPYVALMAVQFQLLIAAVLTPLLYGLEADAVQSAAVAAAVAAGLLAVSRRTAATIVAWGNRRPRGSEEAAGATADLVGQSSRLLTVVLAGPALTLVVTLPMMALSGRVFAEWTAGAISVALLARARQSAFTSELLTITGAGFAGVFGLLLNFIPMNMTAGSPASVVLLITGVAICGIGVAMAVLVSGAGAPAPQNPSGPIPPSKRSRSEPIGMVAGIAIAPLTMGVFGVFGHLLHVGRTLF
jgi:hypothetical protein